MKIQRLCLSGYIEPNEGVEFLSMEHSLGSGLSIGLVAFNAQVVGTTICRLLCVRINLGAGESNMFEGDLDKLNQNKEISSSQRKVLEQAAPLIMRLYQKALSARRSRKNKIWKLTNQRFEIEQKIMELMRQEKESPLSEE